MVKEIVTLAYYFIYTGLLAFLLFILSYWGVQTNWDFEKVSVYECGFRPFKDSRGKFPIQFLMYAIVFLIFDLELSFFFPWSIIYTDLDFQGLALIGWFVFFLLGGFYYEYAHGIFEFN